MAGTSGVGDGWKQVAQLQSDMTQSLAQYRAISQLEQKAMQEQSILKAQNDIVEGTAKMVKGSTEGFKGLC
jgi:hypothetical protein